ncbi:MAG TPA: alpha/beta hydrolase [Candidatus Nanoarchaeia archaeon]|nr:alpha/beta hydrolase [Candidatus Nanoarchaeia archaeon]
MKRVFIIHGWDGFPENHWFPWLKKELQKLNFKVDIPVMLNPSEPKIEKWVTHLKKIVGKLDAETYLIGHSIGCQTIMRYLAAEENNIQIGGIIFVAGFFNLPYLKTASEQNIAKPWLEHNINFSNIKKHAKRIVAIFSDNDPDVPVSDAKLFKTYLNAKIIIEENKGHFTSEEGVEILPNVIDSIKEMI